MGNSKLEKRLLGSLRELTISIVGECPEIEETMTMKDLGLSSQDGVQWACELEDLGIMVPTKLNPYWDDERRQERTVREVLDFIINDCDRAATEQDR